MNKNAAKKWVEALRSGKYAQARNILRDDDTFCCLGVLCEVYREETGAGQWQEGFGAACFVAAVGDRVLGIAPPAVERWAGLVDADEQRRYAYLNDQKRFSFAQIADAIEQDAGILSDNPIPHQHGGIL
jgi:hypothetical protein